ncbi:tetratricopeptide repeat protein [Lacibacter cauensis]|uniref:Tetratricopeptide repeat protein n=1 Tax=Lacibacter cauensis TaxID=510947 RepID=A0A562SW23_9BACT|nr:caspase family protein [Lacibacter cauensis]TWI84996.1 tetratricopeptide repeat protein [Lacibacter cauensis]
MRKYLSAILLLFVCVATVAQQQAPRIFAVVAGVSEYASKGITTLRYANKDAEAFANYLRTKKGGQIQEENLRLLLNEKATTAAIYEALNWLTEEVKENDLVYFYFAGHGDRESNTIFKLGFLLTYNTPRTNYINNAVRIEDVNRFATTLSVDNKAKVIIITDACHSGSLTGTSFRENFLKAEQQRTARNNEIRITSCGPEELAMEDEAWGGGRGVFSYYLVNGLLGFAANSTENVIRVKDIRNYLDSSFAKDPILLREKHQQKPVVSGPDMFQLAFRNNELLVQQRQAPVSAAVMPAPVAGASLNLTTFELLEKADEELKRSKIYNSIPYDSLLKLPENSIAPAIVSLHLQKMEGDLVQANGTDFNEISKTIHYFKQVKQLLESDETSLKKLNSKLVILLHNHAQEVINKYLEGDAAELEKRRYYNAASNGYDMYPKLYALALKLTDPDNSYMQHILQVNQYYFGGVALLLKIPLTKDPSALIEKAFQLEQKALELETEAPYIYNTLGVLYWYKQKFKNAEEMYLKAADLSPQWAIPWSNLLSLYTAQKNYKAAADAFAKARQLGAENSDVYANAGWLYEAQQNFLFAEEMQRKSIFYNSRHFYPFERLAAVYTKTTNYALADSFYYEADLRKRGFNFTKPGITVVMAPFINLLPPPVVCPFDSIDVDKNDVAGYYAWGKYYFDRRMYTNAITKWKHVIELNKKDPIIYHHLGKAYFALRDWPSADVMFNLANSYRMSEEDFASYSDSIIARSVLKLDTSCMNGTYKKAYYDLKFNDQLMASMYDHWNHYTEAEYYYRKLIAAEPDNFIHHKRFWLMLDRIGRYYDEEEVIQLFRKNEKKDVGKHELYAFYQQMESTFPDNPEWHLKAGRFLFYLVKEKAVNYDYDRKALFPDAVKPLPIVLHRYGAQAMEPEMFEEVNRFIEVKYAFPIQEPLTNAIRSLLTADSLIALNDSLSADIHDKVGDLYRWQGVPLFAATHYRKSVQLLPANSGVRLKLIDADDETYQFTDALESLDTLYSRNEINYDKMVLLAKYYLHMSNFKEAEVLLQKAITVHPHQIPALYDLSARLYLLQGKHKEAIQRYNAYLQLVPNDAAAMYSISRMYAQLKDKNKALDWLKKSFANGFKYEWVLKEDPLMKDLRGTTQWNKLISSQQKHFVKYPAPTNSYPHEATE